MIEIKKLTYEEIGKQGLGVATLQPLFDISANVHVTHSCSRIVVLGNRK